MFTSLTTGWYKRTHNHTPKPEKNKGVHESEHKDGLSLILLLCANIFPLRKPKPDLNRRDTREGGITEKEGEGFAFELRLHCQQGLRVGLMAVYPEAVNASVGQVAMI